MPELPEVETTVRAISEFKNKVLSRVVIHNKNLRWEVEDKVEKYLRNKQVLNISRRAKYILIHLDDCCLMIHLGMSGKLRIQNIKDNYFIKHDHAEFIFQDKKIIFNDPRRFGSIHLTKEPNEHSLIRNLGVEPLSKIFNKKYLSGISKDKNTEIKRLIMDQKKVVGVGNIYASESLFLAKIDPSRPSKDISTNEIARLVKSIKKVLSDAIKLGGTTLKDFYSADGNKGYFNLELNVYGKEDKNCKNCKNKIKKTVIGQRATYSCKKCQI
tara:strand:- start:580 stop:1389 length:810 start_codon:yes stop_codon:yes gene_type:complete